MIKQFQPILVVEDSDDDYEITFRAFKKNENLKNPIYRSETGQEALDFVFNRGKYSNPQHAPRPGIILLDLNIPGIHGIKVLKTIKEHEQYKTIPVIVFTTSENEQDIQKCYMQGANTFITKPVELQNFFATIKTLREYWFGAAVIPKKY
ncbi:response regulator [Candidatus Uabimicrobium amorphum]|uniref:Response regulator n=1 Tax=Uabimicrobium amorphum TaxID=2596890 RepID=A0A5S9IQA6_UABAM|nr:response regulator [Candidatus Uabimicrobium amorphum]BBM85737.1 response regulator [Candidatus Uabimicrobium amorphum]